MTDRASKENQVSVRGETAAPRALQERDYWVAFHFVPFVGPSRIRRLEDHFGSLERAWSAEAGRLRAILDERAHEALTRVRSEIDVGKLRGDLERDGISTVTLTDDDYPALLREAGGPPPVLFYRGQLIETDTTAVAIVGTRRVSPYGREVATQIGAGLAEAGVTVVSGLALGVDGIAHQAALEAGGRTIAVLGGGVNRIYPHEHRGLARRISEQGAVLSEYAPDRKPDAPNFPARNRIISGLSLGVVVVEAPERSGALITVDFAADQGRDVFAVGGNVTAVNSMGTNRLIRDGARLVRSADDVLEDLQLRRTEREEPVQQPLLLNEEDRRLLAVLTGEPQHIDDIVESSGMPLPSVSAQLLTLELQGLVRNIGAQHYTRG
ncbi:MAG TPA: DNA-processing protein DprA [Thermomicrobiales bacterium]|nr:DNA-processing protein DprA [Thermomicrobiales bacterium]